MELKSTQSFVHEGNTFQLKLYRTTDGYVVMAFKDATPVSPLYHASYEVAGDWYRDHHDPIMRHLISIAESDIQNNLYVIADPNNHIGIRFVMR